MRNYLHAFEQGGIDGLKPTPPPGRPPTLTWTKAKWEDLLAQSPCDFEKLGSGSRNWTQKLLCLYLKKYHDLTISQSVLSRHLKTVKISWKRVRLRVHSPDPDYVIKRERVEGLRQMALSGTLNPSQATHPPPKEEIKATYLAYFDAADLHWCPDVGSTYSSRGKQVKVDSPGYANPWYALLGSLIYPSGDGYYTIHERKRSAEAVCHLQGLVDLDPDGFWFVILDNASAHHSDEMDSFLEKNRGRIELIYLRGVHPFR